MTTLPVPVQERNLSAAQWKTLKLSIYPGATSESILMVVDYCQSRGLDFLKKPVHIVPIRSKNPQTGDYETHDVIMPGINEYRTTASRTLQYAGQDEAIFGDVIDYENISVPEWCKVTVYRIVGGVRCAFTHAERFAEICGTRYDRQSGKQVLNSMWSRRPYGQLSKCAEAGALRKAFPEELGGENILEEMEGKTIEGEVIEKYVPPYTAEQKDALDNYLKNGDNMKLLLLMNSVPANTAMALVNSFDKGTKVKNKQLIGAMEKEAMDNVTKWGTELCELLNDSDGLEEALSEFDEHELTAILKYNFNEELNRILTVKLETTHPHI